MTNTYHKMKNSYINNLMTKCTNDFVGEIQCDLSSEIKLPKEGLFEIVNKLGNNKNIDINTLLKYYLINQLFNEKNTEKPESPQKTPELEMTANENIKKNTKENLYYKKSQSGDFCPDESIVNVNTDGTYEKIEKIKFSTYKTKNIYSADDTLLCVQLVDPNGLVVTNKNLTVEILGMRKEFVQKFKYSGMSGNSNDIIAAIANKICAPIETGYFVDKNFHFYRWSENQKCFIRNTKLELFSPLLTDYLFDSAKKIIRKEYSGV